MTIAGGCLCGKVRYEIAAEAPLRARQCWCRLCQYLSAGGGTINAIFPKEAFRVTRETAVFTSIADSGAVVHRRFCRAAARTFSARPSRARISSSSASARWITASSASPAKSSGPRWRRAGLASTPRCRRRKASPRDSGPAPTARTSGSPKAGNKRGPVGGMNKVIPAIRSSCSAMRCNECAANRPSSLSS